MMQFFRTNRTPMLVIIAGALALAAYYFVWGGSGTAGTLLSSSPAPSSQSQQLLATLGDLHTVTLDPSIFKDSIFMSLADFGSVIPAQTVGRRNPFAPAGAAAVSTSATKAAGH